LKCQKNGIKKTSIKTGKKKTERRKEIRVIDNSKQIQKKIRKSQ